MNPRGGWAIIKGQLFGFFAEKGFFWTLALGWMTGPVIYLLVWMAASGDGSVGGYDRNGFVVYYLLLIIVNQFTYPTSNWSTCEAIHNGSISQALLRPLPLYYGDIGCDWAVKLVCMPFVLAVTGLLGVLLNARLAVAPAGWLYALAALVLALIIRFLLAHILSLLAFWFNRTDALLSVNDTFVHIFSGQVAPLTLFPGLFGTLAHALPYRYMVSFPIELCMGRLSPAELRAGFTAQGVWLVALLAVRWIVHYFGVKKYSAVGG